MEDKHRKQLENMIAEFRMAGYSIKQIREIFYDCLDNVLIEEKAGEHLGRYGN